MKKILSTLIMLMILASCTQGGEKQNTPEYSEYPITPFTITKESELIGGPTAIGRIGDVLLENDRIRVIIQKPTKNSDLGSFGGTIIDADIQRSGSGKDNFGEMFPMINAEWTVNYYNYEAIKEGATKILRAYGKIDVYDYLDLDFVSEVAEGAIGQKLFFANRFDDRKDPFSIYENLKGINPEIITDYILESGKNYVRMETTIRNDGSSEVNIPMGMFINGSGQVSYLVPGQGFSPEVAAEAAGPTSAIVYEGFKDVDVSYGLFWSPRQFVDPETSRLYPTTSVSFSSVTVLLFGEELLKLMPLGQNSAPEIHFTIPPEGERKMVTYFVVGTGDAGSVLDGGIEAVGIPSKPIRGKVTDASGNSVKGASVALLNSKGKTVVTYKTDRDGKFSGMLPDGSDETSKLFSNGKYKAVVEVEGYHLNGTSRAGACDPEEIDVNESVAEINCTLGESGKIVIAAPAVDDETGENVPIRLTIVGEDPSPNESAGGGLFKDSHIFERPFGIYTVKYLTKKGEINFTGSNEFNIEPGKYLFVFSRGPEYSIDERIIEVEPGSEVSIGDIVLHRAITTPHYISADLHVHCINSVDSSMIEEHRVLAAVSEGLDVLQSTDHDFITDYGPTYSRLVSKGIVPKDSIQTSAGDEVTPNHYGHFNVYPLTPDLKDPDHGALDWSDSHMEVVGFDPDYNYSLNELIDMVHEDPGEEVIQVNHIMDNPTGLLLASGWVTTTAYSDFGVLPLSSYADPVERRMTPATSSDFPLPFGASGLVTPKFTALELVIGLNLNSENLLFRTSVPTWFNLLNLGYIVTAVADSDSHREIANIIGMPRNYIYSDIDPRDGAGTSHSQINLESYAAAINDHRVTISAGPFVEIFVTNDSGKTASIGENINGKQHQVRVSVSAPSWAWFDTIEIYANTIPLPADDETGLPLEGVAADPSEFYKPYHIPRYTYEPIKRFSLSAGTLESWEEVDGVITAAVSFPFSVIEDTWIVAIAKGTKSTEGYKSLFPIVTNALEGKEKPEFIDVEDLSYFHQDERVGATSWGITNPIFIDISGDGFDAQFRNLISKE